MKNKSWGCLVTRTCLKNTVTVPVAMQERSTRAKPASSKRTTSVREAEDMAIPTLDDQSVTSKEDVDALNTLILRKLAKESFMNELGGSRKVEQSSGGSSQCNKATTSSCQCGSHVGNELLSSFPNLHSNTVYVDTTKSNPGSFDDGGKFSEGGVSSLMTQIGLDNRILRSEEPEVPIFQNSSRFNKVPQPRTLVSTQEFLESLPSKDAGEWQGAAAPHSSTELLSLSTEQASNVKSSLQTVGQMWCIPEANSVGDIMCTESGPYHRCSTMETHERAIDFRGNPARSLTAHDGLSPLEDSLLKPHVNSPVADTEASLEEVNALIKGMQLRIEEAAWNLQKSRSGQHNALSIAGAELVREELKDEGVEEAILSQVTWPEQLKTAAHVRWNLRELMKREEIEDGVEDLRTEYIPKQGIQELGCLEELARSLVGKQYETKHEVSGTPGRLELGIAKLKHEEVHFHGDCREDTKQEPNTTQRNQGIPENKSHGFQLQKERIARRALLRQNHVRSSCPGDNCRNVDAKEDDDKLDFQEKTSFPEMRKSVISNDSCDDPAAAQELKWDWRTDHNDLEVLLQFLTIKQQLRENRETDVEAVVQTEAIVRELFARLKVDTDCSSSVDSGGSICFLPKSHSGEPVVDDGYGDIGRKRREEVTRSVDTCEDNVHSQVVAAHQNQNSDCKSKSAIRRPPFAVPSSSKSQCLQQMAGSTSSRKTTSCARNYGNLSEYKAATSPSRNLEQERKRSRSSTVSASQPESCRTKAIDVQTEEVKSDGSHGNVVEGGASTVTGMETMDGTSVMGSAEPDGIPNETKVPHGSPIEYAMPLVSARNLGSRPSASIAPAMTPWNYGQWEKQLPIGRSVQLSPLNKRSLPKSPSSPEHRWQCRDSPTRKSSPNNRPSPLSSPQRQQKLRSAPATSKSTANQLGSPKRPLLVSSPQRQQKPGTTTTASKPIAAQLESPKRPSPLSSPQRQQKPRPAVATLMSAAAHLESPKRPSPLSSPQRQQKPRPAVSTSMPAAAHLGSPKISKTLAKEETDHMVSTTATRKPISLAPDIFPTGISEAVVQESIALSKDSSDPYVDFRDSLLEMMQEKNLWQRQEELQDLLQCFLHLNQPVHHQIIHQAFSDVVSFGSPVSYPHRSSKKERSNAHFARRSSPFRQLYYEVSQPRKSPVRGGG